MTQRTHPRWRVVAAAITAYAACLLLPVAAVSAWVAAQVSDTDRYVITVGPLADDPVIRQAVTTRLEQLAIDAVDFDSHEATIRAWLARAGNGALPDELSAAATAALQEAWRRVVRTAAERVVESPRFAEAWRAANRSAHRQLVAALEGDETALSDDGRVSISLATLLNAVFDTLGLDAAGIRPVPQVEASFQLVSGEQLRRARGAYEVLNAAGFWLPMLWLALVIAALGFAPSRRRTLGVLGYGSVVSVGLVGLALLFVQSRVVAAGPTAGGRDVVDTILDILLRGLRVGLRALLVLAVLTLFARWLTGADASALRVRQVVAAGAGSVRTAVTAPVVRGVAVAVVVLVLVVWLI